ncbi:MAG: carbonic anhydrase family protein [Acidimicrobiales bacterium]
MKPRARVAVLSTAVLLAACGPFGGGDEAKDTSTRPDAPEELARVPVPAGGELPHWTYEGEEGPEFWGEMAEDWALCAAGDEQSPIDVTGGVPFVAAEPTTTTEPEPTTTTTTKKAARTTTTETTEPEPTTTTEAPFPGAPAEQEIDFAYHASAYTVVDNGHTVQVNLDNAGAMVIDGVPFTLVQFHFHTPSEHTLAGAAYPLEYHLVHRSEAGELAVVGVLIQRGGENETLKPIFDALPDAGVTVEGAEPIDPAALLPANRTMVRYNGSLTTPPCTEHVRWHLLLTPLQMSNLQIARFMAKHPESRRPVQEVNDREVVIEVDDQVDVEGAEGADSSHGEGSSSSGHGSSSTDSGAASGDHTATTAADAHATDTHSTDTSSTDSHAADAGHADTTTTAAHADSGH